LKPSYPIGWQALIDLRVQPLTPTLAEIVKKLCGQPYNRIRAIRWKFCGSMVAQSEGKKPGSKQEAQGSSIRKK